MRKALAIVALAAGLVVPVVAFAQPAPSNSPSPELRSMMDKVRAEAKTAAFATLTPARAASVTTIVSQVSAGSLDPRKAAEQIDGMLTGDESKAVMAAAAKSRQNLFEAMQAAGVGPMGPMHGGPGGPPPDGMSGPRHEMGGPGGPGMGGPGGSGMGGLGGPGMRGGPGGRVGFGHPSAGRYLIMVSMTPEQRSKLMPRARSSAAP